MWVIRVRLIFPIMCAFYIYLNFKSGTNDFASFQGTVDHSFA